MGAAKREVAVRAAVGEAEMGAVKGEMAVGARERVAAAWGAVR